MSESKRSHKGLIYTILGVVMSISVILLICAVVFLILYKTKGFSIWMFGAGSEEILPILLTASLLLTVLPAAFIVMNEKKTLKVAMLITMAACVLASGVYLTISLITAGSSILTSVITDSQQLSICLR